MSKRTNQLAVIEGAAQGGLAPPPQIVDTDDIKAKSEKAKSAIDALLASIERLG